MRVVVKVTVDIDPVAWTLQYGVAGDAKIRADVQAYGRSLVVEQFEHVDVLLKKEA